MTTIPSIEDRMADLLNLAATYTRNCKACGVKLYFVAHPRNGKVAPYTVDGLNHFLTCPKAREFRRKPGASTVPLDSTRGDA
jgi:uncharacterized protein with PIN domain